MPEGLSNRAYAARKAVSEGAVRKWSGSGFVVRYADGSINAEATDLKLAGSLDPARTKVRTERVPENEGTQNGAQPKIALAGPLEPLEAMDNPALRGAGIMALSLIRSVPASAAIVAMDAGASVQTAWALRRLIIAILAYAADDLLNALGAEPDSLTVNPEWIDEVGWRAKAKAAGVPYAPKQWANHLAQATGRMEAA